MSFCGGLNSYSAQFLFPASLNVNYEMNKKKRLNLLHLSLPFTLSLECLLFLKNNIKVKAQNHYVKALIRKALKHY
jgi:hypothetical protein